MTPDYANDPLAEQGRADRLIGVLILLVLAVGFAWAQQPVNISQIGGASPVEAICDDPSKVNSAEIELTAGTGNSEIVALSGSTVIYVCGYVLMVGGADTTQWINGTGSACATGETDEVTFDFAADGDGISVPNGGHVQFKTDAGDALCVERTSSVALSGSVTYVQQ